MHFKIYQEIADMKSRSSWNVEVKREVIIFYKCDIVLPILQFVTCFDDETNCLLKLVRNHRAFLVLLARDLPTF